MNTTDKAPAKPRKVNISKTRLATIDVNKNYSLVTVGKLTLHFSYKTLIAFRLNGPTVVRQNEWGPTTGQHLAGIDGGNHAAIKERLNTEAFTAAYQTALAKLAANTLTQD